MHYAQQPWQLTRAALVPFARTYPVSRVQEVDAGPRSSREEDLYAYAQQCRLRETEPPIVPVFAEGTWSIDRFDGLWQLRRYSIRDLVFPGGDPYAGDWGWFSDIHPWLVEKYLSWLCLGHEPPPLRACETERGSTRVLNGHNRAASLVRAGRHETLVWGSVSYVKPSGFCTDLTHPLAVELALRAGHPVPEAVLADYPQLAELRREVVA